MWSTLPRACSGGVVNVHVCSVGVVNVHVCSVGVVNVHACSGVWVMYMHVQGCG